MNTAQKLAEARFSRRDGLPLEVEVMRLENFLQPPHKPQTTYRTRSRFHTLLLIEKGSSSHEIDFKRHCVRSGDFLVIPEGRVHAFDESRVIQGFMALFTSRFVEYGMLSSAGLGEPAAHLLGADLHVHLGRRSFARTRNCLALLADYSHPAPVERYTWELVASAFSVLVYTLACLPEISTAVLARAPSDQLVARFKVLLDERFRQWHRATEFSQALHVSVRTLDRHLVAGMGKTARQAISARLLLEAKRLLADRDIAIKSIAFDLGFSEPQNFTRFFLAHSGMRPLEFRASLDERRLRWDAPGRKPRGGSLGKRSAGRT